MLAPQGGGKTLTRIKRRRRVAVARGECDKLIVRNRPSLSGGRRIFLILVQVRLNAR